MIVDSLKRGIGAGIVAGLAYGLYMILVGNPLVEYMESLEGADHSHGHEHGGSGDSGHGHEHLVSETTTAVVSIGSAVLWGILLGILFGVAYYLFEPVLPGTGALKASVLAGAGFLTISGIPWTVLPPAPPGTEQAMATDTRLLLYAGMIVFGAIVCTLAITIYRRLRADRGPVVAMLAGITPFFLCVLPPLLVPTNVVGGPPTDLLVAFQGLAVFSQLALWVILGATYARFEANSTPKLPVEDLDPDTGTAGV